VIFQAAILEALTLEVAVAILAEILVEALAETKV
jgi:hypothetical protein